MDYLNVGLASCVAALCVLGGLAAWWGAGKAWREAPHSAAVRLFLACFFTLLGVAAMLCAGTFAVIAHKTYLDVSTAKCACARTSTCRCRWEDQGVTTSPPGQPDQAAMPAQLPVITFEVADGNEEIELHPVTPEEELDLPPAEATDALPQALQDGWGRWERVQRGWIYTPGGKWYLVTEQPDGTWKAEENEGPWA